ncbi:MAG: hypothetical protein KZQ64_08175 [gamma proteobacterium symbiont of Bathyaustriella thionipta]|nr:hypothetical protein [gamma proteobacterium symbiont of Bathyaustriella thionipta]MCU7950414.1 hypothetical protein [gamma proteobacterium symbiont of Bathyaustriella thionipta]MCU7953349.1 hypothetical protein [gamma proteobacterium symbiont of Bathyaustriella thionipta]MCU7956911.1 hypothetical protein [gamma proteobacterium symbiont of Bathyaustriella thionipta]MCU7968139.1 hypothetical protein [gamma proteobacterium symbiont of Bathyaustriella thionipta]
MTHIIVHRTHPFQYYGIRFLLLVLAASLLWGAFELGYMQSEEDIIEAKGGRKSLLVQQSVLKKKNTELSKEVLHMERQYLLEQQSCQLVQASMSKDQRKISELEKELAFYKGIVSPAKGRESVYLQSLEILAYHSQLSTPKIDSSQKTEKNQYQYTFILAQKVKKRTYTKGTVNVRIKGKKDNKTVELDLFSLVIPAKKAKVSKDKAFKYSFKYFQEFSGIIHLPEGVEPHSVDVKINSKKKKSSIELVDLKWSQPVGVKYVGQ